MHNPEQTQDHFKTLRFIEQHPDLNLLPLLELVVAETPEYLEAFCNQAIFTVAELLREDRPGGVLPGHVMEIIFKLHTLREAMRQVRGAPSWP
jgi:hypothetical protein